MTNHPPTPIPQVNNAPAITGKQMAYLSRLNRAIPAARRQEIKRLVAPHKPLGVAYSKAQAAVLIRLSILAKNYPKSPIEQLNKRSRL